MKINKKRWTNLIIIVIFFVFLILSFIFNYKPGEKMAGNFIDYSIYLLKMLPLIFILIGLFEVWVKRETIEKRLGKEGGFISFVWAILLGGTTIGPMIVSLPIAYSLFQKGARLSVIFTYIGAASVCRIPMTILEASYLGIKFTVVRYAVSIPLFILTSIVLGRILEKKQYALKKKE